MEAILGQHLNLLIFLSVCILLSTAIAFFSFWATGEKQGRVRKVSAKSSIESSSNAKPHFERRYYLSVITFGIFVLVIALLVPWAISFPEQGWFGLISVALFLGVLSVGFVYAWKQGIFDQS